MFCPGCGANNEDGSRFCYRCGRRLADGTEQVPASGPAWRDFREPQAQIAVEPQPVASPPPPPPPPPQVVIGAPPRPGRLRAVLIGTAGFAAVAAVAAGIFLGVTHFTAGPSAKPAAKGA